MALNSLPSKQGLYHPFYEHEACGVGFVVNIKGKKSHEIITQAATILSNLSHRGASGSEDDVGDGAGILLQLPHKFFKEECNIKLPEKNNYGVGMFFLPTDLIERENLKKIIHNIIIDENQILLGWREVPVNTSTIGQLAKTSMPHIYQAFIKKNTDIKDDLEFERKLYIIRKRIEHTTAKNNQYFYACSLSCRTIVYKGLLTSHQVIEFYEDLNNPQMETALALVHSRYSTNTFPSWERAHPYRYLIHNGEINTLRGNINWMNAREKALKSNLFNDELNKVLPIINLDGSDSGIFDNCLEFLTLAGYSLPHAMMMMIPEPWSKHENMGEDKKAFYEYHSCLMEPWDGPASMAFSDGTFVGAVLDRNGLRPSRYYVTSDDLVIMASEVGVLDIPPEKIICKERLHPGKMLLINTDEGRIISDDEIKHSIATKLPYKEWVNNNLIDINNLLNINNITSKKFISDKSYSLITAQKTFGYTYEELRVILEPMALEGIEPLGSMGTDTPLAVLSDKPQLLYNYFKQLFAQVTNPPIDAIREEIVTSTVTYLGSQGDILNQEDSNCRQIRLHEPIIDNKILESIQNITDIPGFKVDTLPILFKKGTSLEASMTKLCNTATRLINSGTNILILSDINFDEDNIPIPALLSVSSLHHHLIKEGLRTKVSIVVQSGEPREVHHFAVLIGYGASAINPYLAFDTINDMINNRLLTNISIEKATMNYIKACTKGIIKIISKMGISTIKSYRNAQIFETLGISEEVIDKYFCSTPSRIGGIGLDTIAKECEMRHNDAFRENPMVNSLTSGGEYKWRKDGEYHLYNAESIYKLQRSCQTNDYNLFKEYTSLINDSSQKLCNIRGLMEFTNKLEDKIPIDEVESIDSIIRRFKAGAMSFGSISQEAHECIAIAMNRLNAKSNTGEGGEAPRRFTPLPNGDSMCSAIKQVASGRFGVTSNYLVNSKEIQIKMAQGAKPGEGGQLPGRKVYPCVANVRYSTPGVGLISPPPHHDIYSIEDLSQLIHDLKNANPEARISVKLVSEVGVGTVAAGVAKGKADVVLISGYDGGTGASPRTSMKHAGLPWELGVAETHQTLLLNDLRSRIIIETDGKLLTGRDVVIAALLGAEEYGFATSLLITLGCVMMRACHMDTCPIGIATQNPELRKNFKGKPEYIMNFLKFIATEIREIMSVLGFRTVNEMIGRTDKLQMNKAINHWKAKNLDISNILYKPELVKEKPCFCNENQSHQLDKSLDIQVLLSTCQPAILNGEKVTATLPIKNTNRVVGTILGSEVSKRYGESGLPDDTIVLNFIGSAGQSFGAFITNGITLTLEGDSNDYIGKGICGGKIIVTPPKDSIFKPEENIIIGNVAFYGATSGEAYIRGIAGERFCVRNSGLNAVVEGVGDHGCEYMTGGCVVVLGKVGRNFAAGMSGGIAYVLDENNQFNQMCNKELVSLETINDTPDIQELQNMIRKHILYTDSKLAANIINNWEYYLAKFVKVIPNDYKKMVTSIKHFEGLGFSKEESILAAFKSCSNN